MNNWRSCGYLSLTKDGKKVTVMVKHVRYVANLNELKAVLEGKLGYTEIFEPLASPESDEEWLQLQKSRKAEILAVNKEIR